MQVDLTACKQDLFTDNFLLQLHPQLLLSRGSARPRVYIIDFETAIDFDAHEGLENCLAIGFPFPNEIYERPLAPELDGDEPYCPFMLDIWQFAQGLEHFRVSVYLFSCDHVH